MSISSYLSFFFLLSSFYKNPFLRIGTAKILASFLLFKLFYVILLIFFEFFFRILFTN
jgi:hypothetical protein